MDNTSNHPVAVNDANFDQEVIEASKTMPVFVDFWAEWCPPCKAVAPVIDRLSEEYNGKMKFTKVDVDFNKGLQNRYRIMSIPTLMVFKNGEIVHNEPGAMPEQYLRDNVITPNL